MKSIKAISLWQPWASLIAVGAKKYETRSWATNYRGPLLICAATKILSIKDIMGLLVELSLFKHLGPKYHRTGGGPIDLFNNLPFGKAVAVVDLTKCTKTENCFPKQMQGALPFGDFSPGRYAWRLENVRAIEPFPVTGRQGLFEVELPEDFEARLGRSIP